MLLIDNKSGEQTSGDRLTNTRAAVPRWTRFLDGDGQV